MTVDEVWSWPSAVAAAIAGVAFGAYFVNLHIRRPSVNGRALWATVGVDVLVAAFLFTVSQVIAALWVADHSWPRILSRYGMWVIFAIAFAVCVNVAVRVRHRA